MNTITHAHKKRSTRLRMYHLKYRNLMLEINNRIFCSPLLTRMCKPSTKFVKDSFFVEFCLYTLQSFLCVIAFYTPEVFSALFWLTLPAFVLPASSVKSKLLAYMLVASYSLITYPFYSGWGVLVDISVYALSILCAGKYLGILCDKLTRRNRHAWQ